MMKALKIWLLWALLFKGAAFEDLLIDTFLRTIHSHLGYKEMAFLVPSHQDIQFSHDNNTTLFYHHKHLVQYFGHIPITTGTASQLTIVLPEAEKPTKFVTPGRVPILAPISWRTIFRSESLRLDSSVYFYKVVNNHTVQIFEVYSIKRIHTVFQSVGNFTLDGNFNGGRHKWDRRMNLFGIQLKGSLIEFSRMVVFNNSKPEQPWSGGFIDVASILEGKLNFSINYVHSIDGFWGRPIGNDDELKNEIPHLGWNGMVGMLIKKTVDICTSGLAVNPSRSEVIKFGKVEFMLVLEFILF